MSELIKCSGCGGRQERPGGSKCKHLRAGDYDLGTDSEEETPSYPNSGVAWSTLLSTEELANMPDRNSAEYLALCEKTVSELSQRLDDEK